MDNRAVGQLGEQAVCDYLVDNGCFVVERNYHASVGYHEEIDIIACDGRYLLFVEVKSRKNTPAEQIAFAVTPKKQEHIRRCAQQFLLYHTSYTCYQPRFDVACVQIADKKVQKMEYYENAF